MKIIKFDLPIDGVNVKTIEELREHFTVEILTLYNNGMLLKWLHSRKYLKEASHLEAMPATLSRFSLLKTLCEIFVVEADDMIISAALGMLPEKMERNFPEIKAQYRAIASAETAFEASKPIIEKEYECTVEVDRNNILIIDLENQIDALNIEINQLEDNIADNDLMHNLAITKWSVFSSSIYGFLIRFNSRVGFRELVGETIESITTDLQVEKRIKKFGEEIEQLNKNYQ
jgi:hypothetical protein